MRDGSVTPSDLTEPKLTLACRKCGLHENMDVEGLMAKRGDLKLTNLRYALIKGCLSLTSMIDQCAVAFL